MDRRHTDIEATISDTPKPEDVNYTLRQEKALGEFAGMVIPFSMLDSLIDEAIEVVEREGK